MTRIPQFARMVRQITLAIPVWLILASIIAFGMGATWGGIGILALLVLRIVLVQQQHYYVIQYSFFLRYALLIAILLVAFPFVALYGLPEILGALFEVGFWGAVTISVLVMLCAWTVMFVSGLLYLGVAIRNGLPFDKRPVHVDKRPVHGNVNSLPPWFQKNRFSWFGLLALPTFFGLLVRSESRGLIVTAAIILGIFVATGIRCTTGPIAKFILGTKIWGGIVYVGYVGQQAIRGGSRLYTGAFGSPPRVAWWHQLLATGHGFSHISYSPASTIDFSPRRAFRFLLVTVFLYLLGYWVFEPPTTFGMDPHEPALAYLIVLFMLWCWVLNFLAFYCDFYRVPVVMMLILGVFILYWFNDIDHYYEVKAAAPLAQQANQVGPRDTVKAWLKTHPSQSYPVMTLVAASGGGIRASYWTNVVLNKLVKDKDIGPELAESIVFMSAVSGGSVGALHAMDAYPKASGKGCSKLSKDIFEGPVAASGHPGLHGMAWGLAYPDFFRKVFPVLPRNKLIDRGWALEQEWTHALGHAPTLLDWQKGVKRGCRPAIVFNTTVAETGDRFLVGTIEIPKLPKKYMPTKYRQAKNFLSVFKGCDINAVTAARLSATFPYVTSISTDRDTSGKCRPLNKGEPWGFHIADGGYYDNFGVLTIVEFLIDVFSDETLNLADRDVLVIQIRSSEIDEPGKKGKGRGFKFAFLGPVTTMMNVRSSTQVARNDLDLGLINDLFGTKVRSIRPVAFELGSTGPLSWDLTEGQKNAIQARWKKNHSAADDVRKLFSEKTEEQSTNVQSEGIH